MKLTLKLLQPETLRTVLYSSVLILAHFSSALGQEMLPTLFDKLYPLSIERVDVLVDLDSLIANKMTDKEHTGQMKVYTTDGQVLDFPLDIEVRSKSRRRYCDFPPLKFDFVKGNLEEMGLDRKDDYKIVTHCLNTTQGDQCLLKEYMLYEIYQMLTPMSLRAKLFDIQYLDVGSSYRMNRKAILLESEDEFAAEFDGTLCDCMGTKIDSIDPLMFELLAMYQYMVGNNDMNYLVERNLKLIKRHGGKLMVPVAYDFDFAAFVNAPYVHPNILDNRVLNRSYLGYEGNAEYLDEVKSRFLEKKDEILDYIKNFDALPKSERKTCLRYIKGFYRDIEDPDHELPYSVPQ